MDDIVVSIKDVSKVYKLFDNKEKEGNFLEYIKEYDKYDDSKEETKEEEIIVENKDGTTTAVTDKQTTEKSDASQSE